MAATTNPFHAIVGNASARSQLIENLLTSYFSDFPAAEQYELVWEDQFKGNTLDPNKWEVRGVGPRSLGFISPEAVKVENGYLKLAAFEKEGRILLGAVGTQNHFMTRYGFFECRAQLQKSPGIWGTFWIQSTEIAKGEDPAAYGAEIDIMEFFKKPGPDIVSHNVHWAYGPHQQTTHGMQSYLKGVSDGFHNFAVEWTPEKYVFCGWLQILRSHHRHFPHPGIFDSQHGNSRGCQRDKKYRPARCFYRGLCKGLQKEGASGGIHGPMNLSRIAPGVRKECCKGERSLTWFPPSARALIKSRSGLIRAILANPLRPAALAILARRLVLILVPSPAPLFLSGLPASLAFPFRMDEVCHVRFKPDCLMKSILSLGVSWSVLGFLLLARAQMTDVLTYHNDNGRTGQALREEILTPANVNTNHFGKLWILPTDGKVDAEPLYAAGVLIPGHGLRNVLYVVTEHDSVYAYDADSTNLFWQVSMLLTNETTSDARNCNQVTPEIGITSTPVIDRQLGSNGAIFVVAMSKKGSATYFHRLHALDLGTGADRVPPMTVSATFPSSGGTATFDPAQYKERASLLLLNGVIYTAWSSHCDITPYTGWIMGFDETTLAQTSVLNVTPNGSRGAIWMAGGGLCADTNGFIYFLDANGSFDPTLDTNGFPAQNDFGNAFLKLSISSNKLAVADYFANDQNVSENENDGDLGSGGSILLPDMTDAQGNLRKLAVGAGKDANIYLVDRQNLGKYSSSSNVNYQTLGGALGGGVFSVPAYFNGVLYYGAVSDHIKAFPFARARLLSAASQTSITFPSPGATPSISANGAADGIVWATQNTFPAILYAYNATNLAFQLYNSAQAANGRDNFGAGNKYITPMIASARVYVGTTAAVGVFGLLDQTTLTPIEIWRNTNFSNPSNVGAGADGASPSGDHAPNLIKYALGLSPSVPITLAQLPTGSIQTNAGQGYLTLTVNRSADPPDVSLSVQVSSDLINWESGSTNTVTLTNTPSQLVVRDNTPFSQSDARFIRLIVSDP
jgi:hypothetical protein